MTHLLILTFFTVAIIFFTIKIWKLTQSWGYVLAVFFIYYWSLLGSWFVCIDLLNNNIMEKYGLHYYHIYDLLFKVNLDHFYLQSIIYYGSFIIIFQLCIIFFSKKFALNSNTIKTDAVHNFNPLIAVSIALISITISFLIELEDIIYAIKFGDSIYTVTRKSSSKFYTIHQLTNQISISIMFFTFILMLKRLKNKDYIISLNSKYNWLVVIVLMINVLYLTVLGNKHELFTAGIFSLLFFVHDRKITDLRNLYLLWLIPFFVVPLMFNDPIRALLPKIINSIVNVNEYKLSAETIAIMKSSGYESKGVADISNSAFNNLLYSNEMFYAHFSLYGILMYKIPLMKGAGILSLFSSLVPKIFSLPRSIDSYNYYAIMTHVKPGQGYTINHIAAWYLNFGTIGIALGAFLLAAFFNIWNLIKIKTTYVNQELRYIFKLTPLLVIAFIPNIIRTGPEGYKSLLFEGIIIPSIMILLCLRKAKTVN
ncbi:MAG TPA: hypothetical protein PK323_05485 [Bacteroidia bacterium]|nr:hypothetical protein [Bacteroidia bacterium]